VAPEKKSAAAEPEVQAEPAPQTFENPDRSYSGLPEGTHAGLGGVHGTLTIPSGGSYSTDDPIEQGFIEGVLGGTAE
jgi:hypothetical protein